MRSVLVVFLAFLLCVMTLGSCSEDESVLKPAHLTAVTPTLEFVYIEDGPVLASVRVTNKEENPLAGVNIVFTIKEGDAELTTGQMLTDANGIAYTSITFHPGSEEVKLEVSTAGLSKVLFTYKLSESRATQINIIWGNNQQGLAGEGAPKFLMVKVTDDFGNKPEGVPVKFVVLEGNGKVSSEIASTDYNGEAQISFQLSDTTIVNRIAAILGTDSVFFTLESLYPSEIFLKPSINQVEVKWEKNHASKFQRYDLYRAGPDGIFLEIATLISVNDTVFTDSGLIGDGLAAGATYVYKLVVRTEEFFVESISGIQFGEHIFLQGPAVDFEIDESRNQLYVSLPTRNEVHVFDLNTHQLKEKIPVGSKPHGISLSHDKSTLYIALFGSGDVAFLDLTTKQITKVDVEDALGDLKAFDVLEGAPGRVFVTGSPESYGMAFITLIKTDEGNTVERFMQNTVRFQPRLAADYGKFIYVISGTGLYKLDPNGVYTDFAQQPDYSFPSARNFLLINPSGTKLYLDFEAMNTNPISPIGQIGANVPALSPDGSVVHYYASSMIRSYSTTTLQKFKEKRFITNYLKKLALTSDNSTFLALSVEYGASGDKVYFISNE